MSKSSSLCSIAAVLATAAVLAAGCGSTATPAQASPPGDPVARTGGVDSASTRESSAGASLPDLPADLDHGAPVRALSLGHFGGCVIRGGAGTVWCWGDNLYAALVPDHDVRYALLPQRIPGLRGMERIRLGHGATCAEGPSGTFCWGSLPEAVIGRAEGPAIRRLPDGVSEVEVGYLLLCSIGAGGQVRCWYQNEHLLGLPPFGGPIPNLGPMVEVAVGSRQACTRSAEGEVFCFGEDPDGGEVPRRRGEGPATQVALPAPARAIAVGVGTSCALLDDDRVFCWDARRREAHDVPALAGAEGIVITDDRLCARVGGADACMEMPEGCSGPTCRERARPIPLSGSPETFAATDQFGCALQNGAVQCWGAYGFRGDGSAPFAVAPVEVEGVGTAAGLRLGMDATWITLTDGRVLAYGGEGVFANGEVVSTGRDLVGRSESCWWTAEGAVTCRSPYGGYGEEQPPHFQGASFVVDYGSFHRLRCAIVAGRVRCDGTLFDGTPMDPQRPVAGITDAVEACASLGGGLCFRERSGRVLCHPLDLTDEVPGPPFRVITTGATTMGCGGKTACAVIDDGTVRCWGSLSQASGPETISATEARTVPGIRDAVSVAAGRAHMCAVRRSAEVACWGYNGEGQLGDGTATSRWQAAAVPGLRDVVEVAAGFSHTCARHRNGRVSCFGNPMHRAFGTDPPRSDLLPAALRLP